MSEEHTHTHVAPDGTVYEHIHTHEHEEQGHDHHEQGHTHEHEHSHAHGHTHTHANTKAVLNRLSRAIGHLESIRRMVEKTILNIVWWRRWNVETWKPLPI